MVRGDIERGKKAQTGSKKKQSASTLIFQGEKCDTQKAAAHPALHLQTFKCSSERLHQVTSSGDNHSRRHRVEVQSKSPKSTPSVFGMT